MGCGESRQAASDKKAITDPSKIKLEDLTRSQRFEMQVPLTLTDVEVYFKAVKGIQAGKKSFTVQEFLEGMKAVKNWQDIKADSIFMNILNGCPLLKDEQNKNELSRNALFLWGIVLCSGKSKVKTTVFYDVLQDNGQEQISATDKDFPANFNLMVDLATQLVNDYESKYSGQEPEHTQEILEKLHEQKETLAETEFLDLVFGNNSIMKRDEWEKNVVTKVKWMFDSSQLRSHIYHKLGEGVNIK